MAALGAAVALAACSGDRFAADDIQITRRTAEADNWSRYLPDLYNGLNACLAAHPSQPAYVAHAVPQNRGMMLVETVGADGSRRECSIDTGATRTPVQTEAGETTAQGPIFTPATMPEPFQRCGSNDPVFHRDGRLLGWVTHFRTDCHESGPAAQQNWRAFGNEPYWNLRVTGDSITLDRLGQPPRHYPSKPPTEGNDRWTWMLDSPDGDARNALELVIFNTPCGDTMADRRFDFRSEVTTGGQQLRGCAEKLNTIP